MTSYSPVVLQQTLNKPPKAQEVALRWDTVSADRYTDADYLRREFQNVWHKVWNIGGVAYQMPEPGDYLTAEIGVDSVIMVRQDDGSVKALFNSCPHRGTRITEATDGHAQQFSCPYHGWEFNRQGVVTRVPDEEDFSHSPCGTARLKEMRCEERFGLIWFNFDDNALPLAEFLGATIVQELESHRIEEMLRVLDMTAETKCNWKIITDNFNEAYHVKVLHPELVPYIAADYQDCQFDTFPNGHNRGWFPSFMPSKQYASDIIGEPLKSMAAMWELNSDDYVGRENWQQLRVDVQKAKREQGPAKGYTHYTYRSDYQLTDYVIYNLFPSNVITVGPDGVQLLRSRPHPTDPAQCLFDHWWLVNEVEGQTTTPSPAGGPDLAVEDAMHEHVRYGEKTLGTTADQDLSIAEMQQQGLASAGFQGYWLPDQERRVQAFHEYLNDLMSR
ncbi:aromatic ring-hydroxylating dioxygenase subunit alpha [Luminiphilus sp.]|jgi:phenylpropionate dioxygenase-like ring-hydroxylating dioxygenase large terminal subunit|nr:aromatic ring-hydroxylating dioxygenase subunit alpha [Luminiphilus sp.]